MRCRLRCALRQAWLDGCPAAAGAWAGGWVGGAGGAHTHGQCGKVSGGQAGRRCVGALRAACRGALGAEGGMGARCFELQTVAVFESFSTPIHHLFPPHTRAHLKHAGERCIEGVGQVPHRRDLRPQRAGLQTRRAGWRASVRAIQPATKSKNMERRINSPAAAQQQCSRRTQVQLGSFQTFRQLACSWITPTPQE